MDKHIIKLCPKCKKYLGRHYKYCIYCREYLEDKKLILIDVKVWRYLQGGEKCRK